MVFGDVTITNDGIFFSLLLLFLSFFVKYWLNHFVFDFSVGYAYSDTYDIWLSQSVILYCGITNRDHMNHCYDTILVSTFYSILKPNRFDFDRKWIYNGMNGRRWKQKMFTKIWLAIDFYTVFPSSAEQTFLFIQYFFCKLISPLHLLLLLLWWLWNWFVCSH